MNETDLLWMLHAPFWQQIFFICMAAGIALFIHAIFSWTDWKQIKFKIKEWIIWLKTSELPKEKERRKALYAKFKK
jgi:DNA modification methylase